MNKKLLLLLLCYLFSIAIHAQDTIEQKKNLFTEARYHYYLKTILLYNEI